MVDYDNGETVLAKMIDWTMRLKRKPLVKKVPCSRIFDVIVLFDGSVRLCAARINKTQFDDMVIGNIKTIILKIFFIR